MEKYILPILAGILVIVAAIVLIVVPREQDSGSGSVAVQYDVAEASGDALEILASQLYEDKITLLRISNESKVELVAIKDADGKAKVALGTCQSCNGSPRAYYTQTGNLLQCNNCGLTFPLSVIGEEGSGCHPIMLDGSKAVETKDGVRIDRAYLESLEPLFANIAEH